MAQQNPTEFANVPRYAVIGLYFQGESNPTLMSVNDLVVIFDTPQDARDMLPRLGPGRIARWSDSDTICWLDIDPEGISRAVVLWDYNPYDAPHGRSEAKYMDWKHHINWLYVFADVGQWEQTSDGRWFNAAIGKDYEQKHLERTG